MEVVVREVTGEDRVAVLAVEETVFLKEGYPYNYREYDDQSVVLGAFLDGKPIGALRLIAVSPLHPPVIEDCKVFDPGHWVDMGDQFEEVGTVAVLEEYQHLGVGVKLYFTAYGNALARGVTHWGIVLEPERVEFFNTHFFFTFEEIGEIGFKGWACAPCAMRIEDAEWNMYHHDRNLYNLVQENIPERFRYRFETSTD